MESDRINKREDRPLVRGGELSPAFALWFSIIALVFSTVIAALINIYAFGIAFIFNILTIAYNYKLKDLPLAENIIYRTKVWQFRSCSEAWSYGIQSNFSPVILSIFAIAFIAGVAREIIKSVEDMEGTRRQENQTRFQS